MRNIPRHLSDEVAARLTVEKLLNNSILTAKGCWQWIGYVMPNGYGQTSVRGKQARVHRIAYQVVKGDIPKDMEVMHLCDNTVCVNPAHLELGTGKENIKQSIERGRRGSTKGIVGRKGHGRYLPPTHCIHGHEFTETNTYITPDGRRQCRACHVNRVHKWGAKIHAERDAGAEGPKLMAKA